MSEVNKGSNISSSDENETFLSLQENTHNPFYQFVEEKKALEIKSPGRYVLSVTEKGQSVVFYDPNFFEEDEANALMDHLFETTNWKAKNVTIRGIEYPQPRLVAWYGPFPYSYSGITLEAAEMPCYIFEIKEKIEQYLRRNGIDVALNSVLLNLYRHNKDSVSWHSDDESSMGCMPTIASVSLGETRKFEMRRKLKPCEEESSCTEGDEYFVHLTNGSLLIMDGSMQKDWQHRVPKEIHDKNERINLTFRTVYKVESLLPYPDIQMKMPVQRSAKKLCKRKIIYDEKNGDHDTKSAYVGNGNENLSSSVKTLDETNRSEEQKNFGFCYNKTSLKAYDKANEEIKEGIESCSYDKITLKTRDILGEEQDVKISYNKESTLSNNLNDDMMDAKNNIQHKYLDYDSVCSSNSSVNIDTNAVNNSKSICMEESQSVPTNSIVSNINKSTCKIKNEPECSTVSLEAEEFLPINNTFTKFSENNSFGSHRLESLLSYNINSLNGESFVDYAIALKSRVLENIHVFELSEKSELEFLCKLTDGTQSKDNQKSITLKMHSIVDKAMKLQRDSPNSLKSVRNSRQSYHRNRSPYPQRWNQINNGGNNCK